MTNTLDQKAAEYAKSVKLEEKTYVGDVETAFTSGYMQAVSEFIDARLRILQEHGEKLDSIIDLLQQKNKMNKSLEIREMKASDFARKKGLGKRICNPILADAYNRNRVWTVGEVYDNGIRLRHFGKKSLQKFREAVDEVENK